MSKVLTLLPLGSAAGEWARTFKKFLPYKYQFQESRDWGAIKICLLTRQQYLVPGRNPLSMAHLGWWWAADHSSASDHLGAGLHSSYLRYHMEPCSTLDPFICQCGGKTSSKGMFHNVRIHISTCVPLIYSRMPRQLSPSVSEVPKVKCRYRSVFSLYHTIINIFLNRYHQQDLASTGPVLCGQAYSNGDVATVFSRIRFRPRLKCKQEVVGLC